MKLQLGPTILLLPPRTSAGVAANRVRPWGGGGGIFHPPTSPPKQRAPMRSCLHGDRDVAFVPRSLGTFPRPPRPFCPHGGPGTPSQLWYTQGGGGLAPMGAPPDHAAPCIPPHKGPAFARPPAMGMGVHRPGTPTPLWGHTGGVAAGGERWVTPISTVSPPHGRHPKQTKVPADVWPPPKTGCGTPPPSGGDTEG